MINIIEGLQAETNRVREIIQIYEEVPKNAGKFAANLMKQDVKLAENAIAQGDTLKMLSMYKKLKEWEV